MKIFFRMVLAVLVVLPGLASAQSNADVMTQAQALLNQVMQLQQQLGISGGTTANTPSVSTGMGMTNTDACPRVGITLKPGMSGADVTRLQQFLALDSAIYPEGKVTGYYGALTQAAVGRWQSQYNIVQSGTPATTGFGVFGPKTAAAVALQCARTGGGATTNDPVVGGFIKVTPVSGDAPLTVQVEATVNTVRACAGATYTLSWGDNSSDEVIVVPAGQCEVLSQSFSREYQQAGSYTIKLTSGPHETTSTVVVSGAGVSNTTSGFPTGGTVQNSTLVNTDTQGSNNAISMSSNTFSPKSLTIPKNTKVTWTNNDTSPHTVSADNASYNSGSLAQGETFSLTFTIPGEYTYYCAYNGAPNGVGMAGRIIVQ